jgi:hypothetical protein
MNPRIPCELSNDGLAILALPTEPEARERARQFLVRVRPALDFLHHTSARLTQSSTEQGLPHASASWGIPTPPSPIAYELPAWLLERLQTAHPDVDLDPFELAETNIEPRRSNAFKLDQLEMLLHEELRCADRILDNYGRLTIENDPRGELFILEPYQLTPASLAILGAFCDKYHLAFRVTGASSYNPNSTIRIEIHPDQGDPQ